MFITKNGTLTLIKGGKMPELDSVKICTLSEEAQAKIDSKLNIGRRFFISCIMTIYFALAIQMFRPETPYILKK